MWIEFLVKSGVEVFGNFNTILDIKIFVEIVVGDVTSVQKKLNEDKWNVRLELFGYWKV